MKAREQAYIYAQALHTHLTHYEWDDEAERLQRLIDLNLGSYDLGQPDETVGKMTSKEAAEWQMHSIGALS